MALLEVVLYSFVHLGFSLLFGFSCTAGLVAQKHIGSGVGEMCAAILAADKNALPNKNPIPKSIFPACCWCLGDLAHSKVTPDNCSCTTEELTVGGGRCFLTQLCHQTVLCVAAADVSVILELSWCSLG